MKRIIVFILLIIAFTSCDYYDGRLKIINNLDKVVCFDYDIDTVLEIPSQKKKEFIIRDRIDIGDSISIILPGSTEQWIREVLQSQDSTLHLFVFDYEMVATSNWDSLRFNNQYIERLDFKLNELNRINWRIELK